MITINEIFYSVQGESTYAGQRCVFVRLTACDLRCSWCDTPYAFYEGRKRSLDDVLALAKPVLRHRMALNFAARADGITLDDVIDRLCAPLR